MKSRRRGPLPREALDRAQETLKPFQKRTVRTVVDAMFKRESPQRRFLVADEVGLGKTKVARAVVAETIKGLWTDDKVDRIDIVYICSNQQIARQNIEDLHVLGDEGKNVADRITMLPKALADLGTASVNLVAFTPDTSLRMGHSGGRVGERAMLHKLLAHQDVFGPQLLRRRGAHTLFQGGASAERFARELAYLDDVAIPAAVTTRLATALRRRKIRDEFDYFSDARRNLNSKDTQRFIGSLRKILAEVCIELLTPDLIILDEFQRFTGLLDGEGEDGELANLLLKQSTARVLLLSATPYRMLTNAEDDESHFDGFVRTIDFLLGDERRAELDDLQPALGGLRRGILGHRDPIRIGEARERIETILRSVMVRTERLAVTPGRDGMLKTDIDVPCTLAPADVDSFVATDHVAQTLSNIPSMVEYWKSAPYLFNFMDEYKVKSEIKTALAVDDGTLARALTGPHMLDWSAVNNYQPVDSRNGRLRWLLDDLDKHRAFDRLWMPPALPQTELRGAYADPQASTFTKRLIFSGWTVVPKAVAALTSYEFERRNHRPDHSYDSTRTAFSGRLVLSGDSERFTTLAVLLPCARLAELGDPMRAAEQLGVTLPIPLDMLRQHVAAEVKTQLQPLLDQAVTSGPPRNRWYAAAQFYLDPDLDYLQARDWNEGERESAGLSHHLAQIRELMGSPAEWGRPPDDLVDQLTEIAIGSPAVTALRSLMRLAERFGWTADEDELRKAAARVSWAFRSFFNTAEADQLIASSADGRGDFWQWLLQHCVEGGLGSVLDEWFHLVPDQRRLGPTSENPLGAVTETVSRVLRLEGGRASVDLFGGQDGSPKSPQMRTHFAMRFGQARGTTAEGDNPVDVRNAFNSPFRPFVLVSTSVGQEGLDFHHYAHAIVHWNLPGNPVDLEQREGRVHRYKNHAVRKNIAQCWGETPEALSTGDPWSRIFSLATEGEGDMMPWWIYPGAAAIERLVPMLPMSRELGRLQELVEATSLYRMTMGQPRQAELLEVLAGLAEDEQELLRQAVMIDLGPGPIPES